MINANGTLVVPRKSLSINKKTPHQQKQKYAAEAAESRSGWHQHF